MKKLLILTLMAIMSTSCTLSFQNIMTSGEATDVVDENLQTSPRVSVPVTVRSTPVMNKTSPVMSRAVL
jgi:hypothetical protein